MICSRCRQELSDNAFYRNPNGSLRGTCKLCFKAISHSYYEKHKDRIKSLSREYHRTHISEIKTKRAKNLEHRRAVKHAWHLRHREYESKQNFEYRQKNLDKIRQYAIIYVRNRLKNDPLFRFKHKIRSLVRDALRRRGFSKDASTLNILGCSLEEAIERLKLTAIKNYGFYDSEIMYHIDHIIPLATATTYDEVVKLNHINNLQLLTPADNLKKSDKLPTVL